MKTRFTIISIITLAILSISLHAGTIHDFKAKTIDGDTLDFSTLEGKRLLIVNTASKCGYTPQYADLQQLYETYGGDKFLVIGFPANNFGNQEPGDDEDIDEFCKENYGVTFQMMSKISVKGTDMHKIYKWLTMKSLNGVKDAPVQWNFQKFMVDENGNWVDVVMTQQSPLSKKITNWLDEYTDVRKDAIITGAQSQVYPNPFSVYSTIEYELPGPSRVELSIYNAMGIEVTLLVDELQEAGRHQAVFDGGDLPSGVYYYQLKTDDGVESGKILLAR